MMNEILKHYIKISSIICAHLRNLWLNHIMKKLKGAVSTETAPFVITMLKKIGLIVVGY